MSSNLTPLRYPGGKSRLTNFIKLILKENGLKGGVYAEPFAGGAGVAVNLLLDGYVRKIIINDIDPGVHAFWSCVLEHTDEFCQKIHSTKVDMTEWHKQREIFNAQCADDILELGFSFFFLNRTNRSGILNAGVIGGKNQTGKWKIDARYPKENLIGKIQSIAAFKNQIELYNLDARNLISTRLTKLKEDSLIYLDPPYFHKGKKLYLNALNADDHVLIAHDVKTILKANWLISYDNTPEICSLYRNHRQETYSLNYTAGERYFGSEVIIYSDDLVIAIVENPFKFPKAKAEKALALA